MRVLGRTGGSAPPRWHARFLAAQARTPQGGRSMPGSPEGLGRVAGMVSCGYFQPRARLGDLGS